MNTILSNISFCHVGNICETSVLYFKNGNLTGIWKMDYSGENIRAMTQFDKAIKIQCYRRKIRKIYILNCFFSKEKRILIITDGHR